MLLCFIKSKLFKEICLISASEKFVLISEYCIFSTVKCFKHPQNDCLFVFCVAHPHSASSEGHKGEKHDSSL